jgi:hypothetical protein
MAQGTLIFGSLLKQFNNHDKTRITEKVDTIVSAASEKQISDIDHDRLAFAKIEGPGTILAFLADDKSHVSFLMR